MRESLIGAAVLGFYLIASPVFAQDSKAATGVSDKTPGADPAAAPAPPQNPVKSPEEIAHQAMVEEQERRDREEQAERDRDDQA